MGKTHRNHAPLVVPNASQHHTEARAHHPAKKQYRAKQERQNDVVELPIVAKVQQSDLRSAPESEPVVAAVGLQGNKEEVEHLGESQGDHDKVKAAGSKRNGADDEGEQGRHDDGERPGDKGRTAAADFDRPGDQGLVHKLMMGEDRHHVGPSAKKRGMAEAYHSSVTEDKVQAGRGESEDQYAAGQAGQIGGIEGFKYPREGAGHKYGSAGHRVRSFRHPGC